MSGRWWGGIVCAVLIGLMGNTAGGQGTTPASTQPEPTTLTVMVAEVDAATVNVMARLNGESGRILGNQSIAFELMEPFFGNRPVRLGTATTISTGVATYMYRPSYDGEHTIRVSFGGDGAHASSMAEIRHTVAAGAFMPMSQGAHPIATVWRITGIVAGGVTATVWLGLLGIVIWIWAGLKRTTGPPSAPGSASAHPGAGGKEG